MRHQAAVLTMLFKIIVTRLNRKALPMREQKKVEKQCTVTMEVYSSASRLPGLASDDSAMASIVSLVPPVPGPRDEIFW